MSYTARDLAELRHSDAVICSTCWRLRRTGDHVDHCDCTYPDDADTLDDRRPLIPCRFCTVCGLGVLRGHSQWTRLLCHYCMPRAQELNKRHGILLVPIGIHSFMNGVGFQANPSSRPVMSLAQATAFADQLHAVVGAIGSAIGHGCDLLQARCEQYGLTGSGDVPVGVYLDAADAAGESSQRSWEAFEQFLYDAAVTLDQLADGTGDR